MAPDQISGTSMENATPPSRFSCDSSATWIRRLATVWSPKRKKTDTPTFFRSTVEAASISKHNLSPRRATAGPNLSNSGAITSNEMKS